MYMQLVTFSIINRVKTTSILNVRLVFVKELNENAHFVGGFSFLTIHT